MNLGLSAEQLETRRRYVCAGDATDILDGRWSSLWRRKKGLDPDDDLSDILRVQLGSFTEPFNLAWCEKQTGREIIYYSDSPVCCAAWDILRFGTDRPDELTVKRRPEMVVSKDYPWMACHLDGMTTTPGGHRCPIDAKHVARADDPMIVRYTAAGTHQATVMGCDWWALSVLVGNSRWEVIYQPVDPLFQARLVAAEKEFAEWLAGEIEPEDRAVAGEPPKPAPKLEQVHVPTALSGPVYDALVREKNWLPDLLAAARRFRDTDGAAKVHAIASREIKDLLPPTVGLVEWGLFRVMRDKGGAVRPSVKKADEQC